MKKNKIEWYISVWFICIIAVLSFIFIPLIVIPVYLIYLHLKKLKDISNSADLLDRLKSNGYNESLKLSDLIIKQKEKLKEGEKSLSLITDSLSSMNIEYEKLNDEYVEINEEVIMQSFGFFNTRYDLEDSNAYKIMLAEIRKKQKDMVKGNKAASGNENWTINGSKSEGRKMTNNLIKLAIRSFNNECDVSISKVSVSNINSMERRINKSFETINKLNENNGIYLKSEYFNLKLEELYLALEYAQKVLDEKEEQREIKERMKEEEIARREIEKLKEKVEKEEMHFLQALDLLEKQKNVSSVDLIPEIDLKMSELKFKLKDILEQKDDVLNRERNTRAGYVYVISNIGSFGEGIYKIGMTRRLEPMDRIRELSSASVPFIFDVHAMIFSEDAPALENILHKTFTNKRLNTVNKRKEFFNVTLEEIKNVVESNHDKTIEFKTTALAEDYRQSKSLK